MIAALEFSTWQTGLLAGSALQDSVFSVPLTVGRALIWVSVVLTVISGFQYVWRNRRHLTDEKK